MSIIPSKPKIYRGIRFRSILEIRYAAFFDLLQIPYEYEKYFFNFDGLNYLPDFYLPKQKVWFEVKGQNPNYTEQRKAEGLAIKTGQNVFVAYGMPDGSDGDIELFQPNYWDCGYRWCECPKCNSLGITFDAKTNRLGCGCKAKNSTFGHTKTFNFISQTVSRKDFNKKFSV